MTALQHTAFVPVTHVEASCRGCSAVLLVPANDESMPLCRACRKSEQESDVISIAQSIRALAEGRDSFSLLNVDDRRVALSQLATVVEHARRVTLAVPVVPVAPQHAAVALAHYESTAADEPSPEEREAIYAMEEILDREETTAGDWR